ncbi:hypothetical protein ACFL43_01860 [Thermodesulfobacteriota bacterium]
MCGYDSEGSESDGYEFDAEGIDAEYDMDSEADYETAEADPDTDLSEYDIDFELSDLASPEYENENDEDYDPAPDSFHETNYDAEFPDHEITFEQEYETESDLDPYETDRDIENVNETITTSENLEEDQEITSEHTEYLSDEYEDEAEMNWQTESNTFTRQGIYGEETSEANEIEPETRENSKSRKGSRNAVDWQYDSEDMYENIKEEFTEEDEGDPEKDKNDHLDE